MHIDARLVEDEIGGEAVENVRQICGKRFQIAVIVRSVGKRHVAAGTRLAHRKVLFGVKRKREHIVAPRHQACRTVALMDVAIDDQHPACIALRDQAVGVHGKVVEHAVACAGIVKRVVATRRAIGGIAMLHRQPRRQPCAAIGMSHTVANTLCHRETDPSLLLARDIGAEHFLDICWVVDRLQPFARTGRRGMFGDGVAAFAQGDHHQHVFVEAKRAALRRRRHVIDVVDDVQHRDQPSCDPLASMAFSASSSASLSSPGSRMSTLRLMSSL